MPEPKMYDVTNAKEDVTYIRGVGAGELLEYLLRSRVRFIDTDGKTLHVMAAKREEMQINIPMSSVVTGMTLWVIEDPDDPESACRWTKVTFAGRNEGSVRLAFEGHDSPRDYPPDKIVTRRIS